AVAKVPEVIFELVAARVADVGVEAARVEPRPSAHEVGGDGQRRWHERLRPERDADARALWLWPAQRRPRFQERCRPTPSACRGGGPGGPRARGSPDPPSGCAACPSPR